MNKIALSVKNLNKIYENGFRALDNINLEINQGEIFALLGPNGAGKTTLISAICGIVQATAGTVEVFGEDSVTHYRSVRAKVGLVPQELTTDAFETVFNTVTFSRGLFGKASSPSYIESILKKLSLWDKKDSQIRTLSGGMKRRVMIAKALSHEPDILFLDEPSSGVDVELRKSMWEQVRELKDIGVSIILTTHYLEEAEEMADRIGIIQKGKIILVEEKDRLIERMGSKKLVINLAANLDKIPAKLAKYKLEISEAQNQLVFIYDPAKKDYEISSLFEDLKENSIKFKDVETHQSSLEEIFVKLVHQS